MASASFGQTVKSLKLGSNTVTGSLPDTGTVTLSAAAKSGGLKVALKSGSEYAAVPASVTVASGAKTATFTITTTVVPAKESAVVSASANSSSASADLTIVPPAVTALAIVPTSVICQQSATGTVTINVAAGVNGFDVALKSNEACASVPAIITVLPKATSASFTISTSVVTQPTVVTITATAGGSTATGTLTVQPGNGLSPSGWSKFLANASNCPQGLQPAAKGNVAINVDVFSPPYSAPSVAPDGTVYVVECTHDVKLRALNPNGSTKWSLEFPGQYVSQTPPIVAPNGTIYTANKTDLYAISARGKILWNKAVGSYPAIDRNGILYVGGAGDGVGTGVSAMTSDGALKWTTSVAGAGQPSVGRDGYVYVGSDAGLTKLTPGGAIVWSKPVPWQVFRGGGSTVALADGSIVVWDNPAWGLGLGAQFAPTRGADISASGELRWSYGVDGAYASVLAYSASTKGGLLVLDTSGTLTCLAENGTRRWKKKLSGPAGGAYGGASYLSAEAVTVDTFGNVYVADGEGKFWSFAPTGRANWSCQLGDGSGGSAAIAPDGAVYVSTVGEYHSSPGGGSLYGVGSTGVLNWAHYGSIIYSVPSFGLDGTAYFAGGGGITAFDGSGNFKWCYGNGGIQTWQPTIGSDGTIYYYSGDGFRALTPAGKLKWFYPYIATESADFFSLMPAIGPDGTIYFADQNLYALNPDGTLKWSKSYADWLIAMCTLISPNGTLYLISQGHTGPQAFYAVASNGTLISTAVQAAPLRTISLDQNGNLYTIVYNEMTQLNQAGQITHSFGGTTSSFFLVGADGTVCYRDSLTNNIVINGGSPMGYDWDPFALASDDTIYGVTQTGGTVRAYSKQGQLLWSLPGVSAWTAQYGLFHYFNGYFMYADRPMSIAPDGSLWVFSGYGFVVIK
jgi:hypothetical protein